LAQIAGTVSTMSVGALLTLVVLWSIGTFDAQTSSRAAAVDPSLPVTAADLETPATPAATSTPPGPADAETPADTDAGDDPEAVADAPEVAATPSAPQLADPVRIEIPAIGIAADVIPLGLVPDTNELEVPTDFAQTGWWTGGPEPGEVGPAVIAGHVDSFEGPAVFFALDQLAFDDLVRVTRADGSAATFAVRETIAVDKDNFPTEYVYGSTDRPVLRLITCDGDFSDGSYLGNLIVTAELLAEHPAPSSGVVS
jgi:sortase (surface protein transpeptidase)